MLIITKLSESVGNIVFYKTIEMDKQLKHNLPSNSIFYAQ
jgi:hypothetical protein